MTAPTLIRTVMRRYSLVTRGAKLGEDVCPGAVEFHGPLANLSVGCGTVIGRASVMLHDAVSIGEFVCINDGVTILTATHDLTDSRWRTVTKPVFIGNCAWIATGATLLPGVRVGEGAVVGAGAVVRGEVPPFSIALGNPAIIIPRKRASKLNYCPSRFLAFQEAWLGSELLRQ